MTVLPKSSPPKPDERPGRVPVSLHNALFLHERKPPSAGDFSEGAAEWAAERAAMWRKATALDEKGFEERLSETGLDSKAFIRLLAAQKDGLTPEPRDPASFDWCEVIDDIRNGTADDVELPTLVWNNPDGSKGTKPPFSSFIRPFLKVGMARLLAGLRSLETDPPLFTSGAVEKLYLELIERLVKQCSSTLILELNVARLEGRLEGETPTERFRFFAERSFTPEKVLAMFDEYALLGRAMATTVRHWAAAMTEFCRRLAADRESLRSLCGGFDTVESVELGISDPHRQGRTVAILQDTAGRRVVYKPTSLAVDRALGEFIETVNGMGLRYPLDFVRVIDRGEYGWQRFVEAESCRTEDELSRFYWRQGALIALLHVLRAADFHHENLIACGEHPILIDNEALFQHVRRFEIRQDSLGRAMGTMFRSVLRQAILPFVYRLTAKGDGLDSSGLGGEGGQTVKGSVRRWSEAGTDNMRVEEADLVSQEARNRPSLRGKTADASAHVDDLIHGFRAAYELLAGEGDSLKPRLEGFREVPVRHLLRPTRIYSVFLRESRHPNDLRDGLERDQLLDRLWVLAARNPSLARIVPFELADLRKGDVPAFYTRPDSVDLWSSDGTRIPGFFSESSLEDAHRVLEESSEKDRELQETLIRLTLDEARSRGQGEPPPLGRGEESPSLPMLEAATRLARKLRGRAIETEGFVQWVSLDPFVGDTPDGDKKRNVSLAGSDLYHGTAGIALFLAQLGKLTGDAEATTMARGTLSSMLETRAVGSSGLPVLGAFLGRGSYLYALLHLAALWDEPELLEQARADLPVLEQLIDADEELDVMGGSAGLIPSLLALHRVIGDESSLRLAHACGDHLIRRAVQTDSGPAWVGRSFNRPVAGFSHGSAGIAWSLLELAEATGHERYRESALSSIEAERRLLASTEGEGFHRRISWCHGLPSVALGRLLALSHLDDPRAVEEIETGVQQILRAGPPVDCCLCHGVTGNAEILWLAGRRLGVESWCRTAMSWAETATREVEALERRNHSPLWGRFTGLMCGLSGVGWGLLRFADLESVPSVLALHTPERLGSKVVTEGAPVDDL